MKAFSLWPADDIMICPFCGHDNISGSDVCEECHQSLTMEFPSDSEAQTILNQRLSLLNPRQPECVGPKTTVAEAIERLKKRNVGCVIITDEDGAMRGIFTERDVLYRIAGLAEHLEEIFVETVMTPGPSSLKPFMSIAQAFHLMGLHGFRHVPLVDDQDRPIGFISLRDIVNFIEEHFATAVVSSN